MHAIGLSSAIYLLFVLVLAPALAFRGAKLVSTPPGVSGSKPIPPLATVYANTLVMLAVLFALAWFTARTFAYDLFSLPHLGMREVVAGAAALCVQFALQYVSVAARTPDERRTMPVNRLMPRSVHERALYAIVSIVAGVAEEAAYRGVATSILWYALGNLWIAAAISALAFAAGHAVQGWKSMAVIFVMACSMQALVVYTHTLVVAMAVHAAYDLLAPTIRRRILRAPPTDPERIAG